MNTFRVVAFCLLTLCVTMFGQQETLTDAKIIQMVQSKMSPDLIILAISKCNPNFALDPASTQYMMQHGVSDEIFKAMAAKQSGQPIQGYTAPVESKPPQPNNVVATPSQSTATQTVPEDEYLRKGMGEISMFATAIIPNWSISDTVGEVSFDGGYHVTRGNTIGAEVIGVFENGAQQYFLAGSYHYYVHTGNPKLYPYFGVASGASIAHVGGYGTASNFLLAGQAGIRYFLAKHIALDTAYNLVYVHVSGVPFKYSSYSQIGLGFATVF